MKAAQVSGKTLGALAIVNTQFAVLLEEYRDRMRVLFATAPADLQEEHIPTLGPGSMTVEQVNELEAGLPIRLPASFRAYLSGPRVQCGPESFEIELPPNDDPSRVVGYLNAEELWRIQLLQFASGPCGDPVCFDISSNNSGEFEVVVINHDWVGEEDWRNPRAVRNRISARWPSFAHLLRDICHGRPISFKEFIRA